MMKYIDISIHHRLDWADGEAVFTPQMVKSLMTVLGTEAHRIDVDIESYTEDDMVVEICLEISPFDYEFHQIISFWSKEYIDYMFYVRVWEDENSLGASLHCAGESFYMNSEPPSMDTIKEHLSVGVRYATNEELRAVQSKVDS